MEDRIRELEDEDFEITQLEDKKREWEKNEASVIYGTPLKNKHWNKWDPDGEEGEKQAHS